MATRVRSFSKVNLGLRIGPVREDGFHGLETMYQTLALHDVVTVSARRVVGTGGTRIRLTTDHGRVPVDRRNTVWQMIERALGSMGVAADVEVHLEKRLPIQGGMGAGSANAAAALMGLEREMAGWDPGGPVLAERERLRLAAEVGSDVPLFLIGGTVLGRGRGELVTAMEDLALGNGRPVACVVALPAVGVSTPFAFREWDARHGTNSGNAAAGGALVPGVGMGMSGRGSDSPTPDSVSRSGELTSPLEVDTVEELSSLQRVPSTGRTTIHVADSYTSTSGIANCPLSAGSLRVDRSGSIGDLAGNNLLALVHTGIENDFEKVVFPHHPSLREIKRLLMGADSGMPAIYAALSGSGSALFGLYWSTEDAQAAQQRVRDSGTKALLTATLTRVSYRTQTFADVS